MPETPTFVVNDRRKFTSDGELRHEGASQAGASQAGASQAGPSQTDQLRDGSSQDGFSAETAGQATTGVPAEPERKGPQLVHTEAPNSSSPFDSTASPTGELADLPESSAFGVMTSPASAVPEAGLALDPEMAASSDPELAIDDFSGDGLPPGPTAEESAEAARAYDATAERLELALRAADPGGERMPPMTFERLTQSLYTQALILLGGGAQPGETPRIDILGARQTIDMLAILSERTKGNLSDNEDKLLQSALFDLRMGFLEITQALARQAAQRQPAGPGPAGAPGGFGAGPRIVR